MTALFSVASSSSAAAAREIKALIDESVHTVDAGAGLLCGANQAAADFYGYPLERLIGMPIARINTLAPTAAVRQWLQLPEGYNPRTLAWARCKAAVRRPPVHSGCCRRSVVTFLANSASASRAAIAALSCSSAKRRVAATMS